MMFLLPMVFPLYLVLCSVDQVVAHLLEKKIMLWPVIEFTCFCGFKVHLMKGIFIPNRTYSLYKCRKHMRGCLQWILIADFNGLTPYWAYSYAKDLRDPIAVGLAAILPPEWYLAQAKKRSARVKAGLDPWTVDDPTVE
jgi:hypothetical protein